MSHGLRILIGVAAVAYVAALAIVVYTLAEQQHADTRITQQEKFDPCVSLSEAVANKAVDRIRPLTRECKGFLNGIGPLVTIKLSCAIIEKARYACPKPGSKAARREVVAGSGNSPSGQPAPGPQPGASKPGAGHGPQPQHPGTQPPTSAPSTPVPAPPPALALPPPQPGNSGETPASEHSQGVHAIEVVG